MRYRDGGAGSRWLRAAVRPRLGFLLATQSPPPPYPGPSAHHTIPPCPKTKSPARWPCSSQTISNPAWKWVDLMEQHGRMDPAEAQRWKDGIYGLMELEMEDVLPLST